MFPGQSLLDVTGDYLLGPKPSQWLIRKVHNAVLQYREEEQTPHMIKKATLNNIYIYHVLFYTVEIFGNYYSDLFKHSEEPASFLLRNLSSTLPTIFAWHASMIIDSNGQSVIIDVKVDFPIRVTTLKKKLRNCTLQLAS